MVPGATYFASYESVGPIHYLNDEIAFSATNSIPVTTSLPMYAAMSEKKGLPLCSAYISSVCYA